MGSDRKLSARGRWVAAGLVAAAVLAILGMKIAGVPASTLNLPTAEAPGAATVPALGTSPATSSAEPTQMTESDPYPTEPAQQIEWVLRHNHPAMILFHSTNCKPCKLMTDLVQQVRTDFDEHIAFIDVVTNDRSNAQLVQQAQIRAIPTSVFFMASGQGYGFVGAMNEEDLRAELIKLMSEE